MVQSAYSTYINFQEKTRELLVWATITPLFECLVVVSSSAWFCGLVHISEIYFPERHVRYIALNDGVDTLNQTSSMDITPFKHILNTTLS